MRPLAPPPALLLRLQELQGHFPEQRVLLVGGAVRELALGRVAKDYDVEVLGLDPLALDAELAKLWPSRSHCVGKAFAVHKVSFPEGDLDIAANPLRDFARASRRRDFTINAMGWEVSSQALADPFGGTADLAAGQLRCVDPSTFVEDPLRVYRAAQFAARLEFDVDPATAELCERLVCAGALDGLPAERITEEWRKLLLMPLRPSLGLEILNRWGVLLAYPELAALRGVIQDPRWHPEGDVWVHTLAVVDAAARLIRQNQRHLSTDDCLVVLFGALLHDVGKPTTTRIEAQGITAYGHEAAGREAASRLLQRLRLGERIELGILECVTEHMRPAQLTREVVSGKLNTRQATNALRRLLKDVAHAGWPAFLTMCEADKRGRGRPEERDLPYEPAIHLNPLLKQCPAEILSADSLLKGRDLLELGIKPGPRMGRLIAMVEKQRDEGVVATRSEALEWLLSYLSNLTS